MKNPITPARVYELARLYVSTDGGKLSWPDRLKMAWAEYKNTKRTKRKRCKVRAIATYTTKVDTSKYKEQPRERARERFKIRAKGAFYQCKPRPQRKLKGKLSNKHVEAALKREHELQTRIYATV